MGSKSHSTKSDPEILQPLISKISENIGYKLNQILVNKYSGPDVLLPKLSDNEYDINPDSEILLFQLVTQPLLNLHQSIQQRTVNFQLKQEYVFHEKIQSKLPQASY